MGTTVSVGSTNRLHAIWLDHLHELFRCPHCRGSLVEAIATATVKDGQIKDVHCGNCNEDWAFVRIPQGLYERQQLDHAELDAMHHAIDADVSSSNPGHHTCSRCGRELTDPVSIARGLGPVCATKAGVPARRAAFWQAASRMFP